MMLVLLVGWPRNSCSWGLDVDITWLHRSGCPMGRGQRQGYEGEWARPRARGRVVLRRHVPTKSKRF